MAKDKPGAAPQAPEQHIEVASTKGASAADVTQLLTEIADLKAKLQISEDKRTDAEKAALAAAEAQGAMLLQSAVQEVPTGKFVKVKRLDHYEVAGYENNREVLRPVYKTVELPTYFYKIDMPAVGGTDAKINGNQLYHGVVYELDIDTLRSVKEIVYRLWDHERNISGSNENAYRPEQRARLSARAA